MVKVGFKKIIIFVHRCKQGKVHVTESLVYQPKNCITDQPIRPTDQLMDKWTAGQTHPPKEIRGFVEAPEKHLHISDAKHKREKVPVGSQTYNKMTQRNFYNAVAVA